MLANRRASRPALAGTHHIGHYPASRKGVRHYSPKEASAALAEVGITLAARTIQWRCKLPIGHPLRIATNPAFIGRDWIPETEIARLLGAKQQQQRRVAA